MLDALLILAALALVPVLNALGDARRLRDRRGEQ